MADLFYTPVYYGYDEVQIPADGDSFEVPSDGDGFAARIYYPTESPGVINAPLRPGPYPLVIFAHGQRSAYDSRQLCPSDVTRDYRRWQSMLTLMARCGFVVVSPAVHDVFGDSDGGARRLEATAHWMYHHWPGRAAVTYPLETYLELAGPARRLAEAPRRSVLSRLLPDELLGLGDEGIAVPVGRPAPLGLIGHSWGMKFCCRMAARQTFAVSALAGVAGTLDDNQAPADFIRADVPTVLLCGTADDMAFSYLTGLWSDTPMPKHQAALLGLGHWDWFGRVGGLQPCDEDEERPACSDGNRIGAVMLLNFVRRYLGGHWYNPPNLLQRPGGFPPFHFDDGPCAAAVRWHAPTETAPSGAQGNQVLGDWDGGEPW